MRPDESRDGTVEHEIGDCLTGPTCGSTTQIAYTI